MKGMDKRQMILIGILIIVIIYYFIDSQLLNNSSTGPAGSGGDVDPASMGKNIAAETHSAAVIPVDWSGGWKNDPFFYVTVDSLAKTGNLITQLFGQVDVIQTAKFKLTGISWLGNSGFAIINGNIVKENDNVGGFKVQQVAIDYVILKQGAETIRLTLNE